MIICINIWFYDDIIKIMKTDLISHLNLLYSSLLNLYLFLMINDWFVKNIKKKKNW